MRRISAAFGAFVAAFALGTAPVDAEEPARSFERLCAEWTENLSIRERRNREDIQWIFSATGVHGTYVGYGPLRSCRLQESAGNPPVGMLSYLEVQYEMQGWTVPEAAEGTPLPLETTEVTELFKYTGNEWRY